MYSAGFGNHHQSEALPGALPVTQNSPQRCAFDLYAEQLSGTAFTRPRHRNLHSWLYRRLPSVIHQDFSLYKRIKPQSFTPLQPPNPYRWLTFPAPYKSVDFVEGLFHLAGSQSVNAWLYQCNKSMSNRFFCNRDGEMLLVPYQGDMTLFTEFGRLELTPGQIAVIPRGVYFKVILSSAIACGYLCENAGAPLTLPEMGVLGANGLANPRHFLYPTACCDDFAGKVVLLCKYQHRFWSADSSHSPLNVMAWHGNYAPYSYDLSLFNTLNTVSFDHPDPSIFTVLTSESDTPGVPSLDFVIFPPRWMVAEHTFRPPYFHRNIMSELMGLICGEYDARKDGFLPGGVSIHNCMTAHGPDSRAFEAAVSQQLQPDFFQNTLAFMFETRDAWQISEAAMKHKSRQKDYSECWQGLKGSSAS